MAQLYLVRHAKAGERRTWVDDDVDRPLSQKGRKQAKLLAKRLVKVDPPALLSSRYARCIETLEPLAEQLGTKVIVDDRLTEDEPIGPVLELLREAKNGTVLCSHGDIIPAVLDDLKRSGTKLRTPPDWRKATVWVLKRNKKSQVVHATVWPPPVV